MRSFTPRIEPALIVIAAGVCAALHGGDGAPEIRAPCADCTVLMPTREPIVGREGVVLARPLA